MSTARVGWPELRHCGVGIVGMHLPPSQMYLINLKCPHFTSSNPTIKKNYTLNQNFNNIYLNKKVNVLYMIQLSKIDNFIKCIALQLWLYSEK